MFNTLINGAKSGTFSVDKLGDAVKEFSIRAIDGSDTTKQGFQAIGLDANKMAAQFGQGGIVAQKAFQQTISALKNVKNPIAQDAAGVNLFGTMWEDLDKKGIFALGNINGEISNTTKNLQELNNQKYNDATSALVSLGRTINIQLTDVVGGAVNASKFVILDFTSGIKGNLEEIQGAFGYLGYAINQIGNFFVDNWSIISPIIYGITTALGIYTAALVAYNVQLGITSAMEGIAAIQKYRSAKAIVAHALAYSAEEVAAAKATIAQTGFNTVLLACPITWIIGGIIALIVIVFAATAAFNKFTGSTYTGLGVICGAVSVAAAVIWNTVIGLINGLIQNTWTMFVEPFLGLIEWVLNAANGGFDSFGGAVANLIGNIISWFLSLGKVVTKIIDAIFGTDWTAGLSSLQDNVLAWGKNDNAITIDRNAPQIDSRIKYDEAWKAGNTFGDGVQNKVTDGLKNAFDKFNRKDQQQKQKDPNNSPAATNVPSDVKGIKDNTKKSADATEMTHEDLKYLRDIAERDVVNRFTTAEIKVNMGGVTNNVREGNLMDIDKMMDKMTVKLNETMHAVAEGSY